MIEVIVGAFDMLDPSVSVENCWATQLKTMSYSALELNGKAAVVIGGTSGIGRAIAHGLAEAGADVVPTSRRAEQVEAAAVEIESRGKKTLRITSDVSDRSSLEHLLAESVRAFGKVDILVNSAGRTKRAPSLDFAEEDWNAIMETNLSGTLRACQVFGKHMLANEYGRIINIASLSTFVALMKSRLTPPAKPPLPL